MPVGLIPGIRLHIIFTVEAIVSCLVRYRHHLTQDAIAVVANLSFSMNGDSNMTGLMLHEYSSFSNLEQLVVQIELQNKCARVTM